MITSYSIYATFYYIAFLKRQNRRTQNRSVVTKNWNWGKWIDCKRRMRELFWDDRNVLHLGCGGSYLTSHIGQNSLDFTLKNMNFLLYNLYLKLKIEECTKSQKAHMVKNRSPSHLNTFQKQLFITSDMFFQGICPSKENIYIRQINLHVYFAYHLLLFFFLSNDKHSLHLDFFNFTWIWEAQQEFY